MTHWVHTKKALLIVCHIFLYFIPIMQNILTNLLTERILGVGGPARRWCFAKIKKIFVARRPSARISPTSFLDNTINITVIIDFVRIAVYPIPVRTYWPYIIDWMVYPLWVGLVVCNACLAYFNPVLCPRAGANTSNVTGVRVLSSYMNTTTNIGLWVRVWEPVHDLFYEQYSFSFSIWNGRRR